MRYPKRRSNFYNLLLSLFALLAFSNGTFAQITVSGTITCEAGDGVENVVINVGGIAAAITDVQGNYSVELPEGGDYTIIPFNNNGILDGVSTFDVVQISQHISAIQLLSSPYQIIAADVDNSETVDTMDLDALGNILDFNTTSFPNNTSWRFIPANFVFPDPNNPFLTPIPEVVNINNLSNDITGVDFIGIKVGDTNTSNCTAILDTTIMGKITGSVIFDQDENCSIDINEPGLEGWTIEMEGNDAFYANTGEDGSYTGFVLPGSYDVKITTPNNLWDPCESVFSIFIDIGEELNIDFLIKAVEECAFMNVDIATPFLRRCMESKYYVEYCNHGTATATDAYVEIEFDDFLSVESSTLPWSSVDDNLYTFNLGDVELGTCGNFEVTVEVSCDAVLGQSHCTEAHIYPDSLCVPTDPLWDGSNLIVEGYCEGDSVFFQITNIGENMTEPVGFVVIEDIMIQLTSPLQLNSQESFDIGVEANGATWRIEVDQVAFHPNSSLISATVEGCGTNGTGTVSLGIVTQFPMNDEAAFIDVDCRQNIGSYDPNDKMAFPKGSCAAHLIRADTDLEYLIRFQNTGTDTAFNVIIRDTLSPLLDPTTVQAGVSSHPYEFELRDNGVLEFIFENIMLPDSNINEAASHGFVKFKIEQQPDNPIDAVIENQAAIYFDYNLPVLTNTYFHTIGEDYLEPQTGAFSISGTITRHPSEIPEDSVLVFVTDDCPVFTNENGYYSITGLEAGGNYLLTPQKMGDPRDGITVMDVMKLRLAILFIDPEFWDNPLNLIASDVNDSGTISAFDLVMMSLAILDVETINPDHFKWIFHDKSVPLSMDPPFFPLSPSIAIDSLTENLEGQDFYAIKKGDLVAEHTLPLATSESVFFFEKGQDCNGQMVLELKATGFGGHQLNSFQFALNWDASKLEFEDIDPVDLPDFTSSQFHQNDDETLSVVWFSNNFNFEPEDSLTLLKIKFNVLDGVGTPTTFSLDNEQLPFMAFANLCERTETDFDNFTTTVIAGTPIENDANIDHVLCHGDNDGSIEMITSGGVAPFTYSWNTGDSTALIENLTAGLYSCSITDQQGCVFVHEIEIEEPNPLDVDWNITDASSPTANNGSIHFAQIFGGVAPYLFNPQLPLQNLPPDDYVITLQDAHACILTDTVTVSFVNAVDELENLGIQIDFAPNPIQNDHLGILKIYSQQRTGLSIQIKDYLGRKVSKMESYIQTGNTSIELNMPNESGLYFIEIINENGARKVIRVVVL